MFDDLTYEQQLGYLVEAAEWVLPTFGLADGDVTPLMYVSNAVFAVDHRKGQFVLRVHCRGHKPRILIESEMHWLSALRNQGGLCVPEPVPAEDDTLVIDLDVTGIDVPVQCVLLKWVEGESLLPEQITPVQVEHIGGFLAQLHTFSASYQPPPGFERPGLDWEGLFGERSPYNPGDGAEIFQPEHVRVMDAVADRVRAAMQALDADGAGFGLIHADMIAKNILFAEDHVCAIDFDDCAFGYFLYDLAPTLLQFSPLPGYAVLKEALWRGYTAVRPLPKHYRDHLETFVAGRHVASMRWIASNLHNPRIRERAPQIMDDRTEELRGFLETGRLERKSEIF